MRRRLIGLWAATAVVAGLVMVASPVSADTVETNSLVLSHSFKGSSDRYNYAPTAVQVGTVRHYYWCGYDKAYGNFDSDTILTQSIDTKTGHKTPVQVALRPTRGAWDKQYTCNPGVVMGSFTNPTDHRHYRIALFYVGAANAKGVHNSIGVAYSNDWTTFHKRSTPVLSPPAGCSAKYGYGQPTVYNHDGKDRLWLFYDDTCTSRYKRIELDGTTRGATSTVTTKGFTHSEGLEFGYDDTDHAWYAAGNSESDKRAHERGSASFQLYRIPEGALVTGSSSWSEMSRVDTNLVGYESLSIPTVLRDPYGNVTIPGVYPNIVLPYTVTNTHRPAARSTLAADNKLTSAPNWRVIQLTWRPGHPLRRLKRYHSASLNRDEVTTGYVDTRTFKDPKTLGMLYEEPTGQATRALYGCRNGSDDYFVSTRADCEGKKLLGLEGYAYPTGQLGRMPLYRCNTGSSHFVSNDPTCEGHRRESLLGYAQDVPGSVAYPGATADPQPGPSASTPANATSKTAATGRTTPAGEPGYPVKGHSVTVSETGVHIRTWPGGATSVGTTQVGDTFYETRKSTDGTWIFGTDIRNDVTGWIPIHDAKP
jgi:hypothetical protein